MSKLKKLSLKNLDPDDCGGLDKEATQKKTDKLCRHIGELQELFHANASHALLLVFQGMDASGKDGSVKSVLEHVNPAGVETNNFKSPSTEELAHDYLWRIHKAMPRYGSIGVFNRSHYEEVLIVRVQGMKPPKVWKQHYEQINLFEKMLAENRVKILKFYLHISKNEQAERLRARLQMPSKNWKFSAADMEMRKKWDDFQEAYEDAISKCDTPWAPWHLIPANHKWYRNYLIAKTVASAMESFKMDWPKPKEDLSSIRIV